MPAGFSWTYGYFQVSITLRDKNDNPPDFFEDLYRDVIYETIPLNRTLLQVRASDPDLGNFGDVSYYKVPNVGNDYSGNFMLFINL